MLSIYIFVPFFPAWSSQFSKVHGPQAPHSDTSQSMGQGIWHSWDLLGIGPLHSLFSTGREAEWIREGDHKISSRYNEQALLWSYSHLSLCEAFYQHYNHRNRTQQSLFTFIPAIKIPIESRWAPQCKKPQHACEVGTIMPLFCLSPSC